MLQGCSVIAVLMLHGAHDSYPSKMRACFCPNKEGLDSMNVIDQITESLINSIVQNIISYQRVN